MFMLQKTVRYLMSLADLRKFYQHYRKLKVDIIGGFCYESLDNYRIKHTYLFTADSDNLNWKTDRFVVGHRDNDLVWQKEEETKEQFFEILESNSANIHRAVVSAKGSQICIETIMTEKNSISLSRILREIVCDQDYKTLSPDK